MKQHIQKITHHHVTKNTLGFLRWQVKLALFVLLPLIIITFLISRTQLIPGIKSYVVQTGSMTPSIPVGSVTYTQRRDDYKEGDVIAFTNKSGMIITHRIISIGKVKNKIAYQVKGDANQAVDGELVPVENVIGSVTFHLPYIGKIIALIRTPMGFISLIILPTLLFIATELWSIKKEIETSVEKKLRIKLEGETS